MLASQGWQAKLSLLLFDHKSMSQGSEVTFQSRSGSVTGLWGFYYHHNAFIVTEQTGNENISGF